ncbi:hypothetical protein [Frankia sp. Cppng1_Ct_nod]|nr:hypothetical protein [Frankia sp. Cppng1_Ct_nod]
MNSLARPDFPEYALAGGSHGYDPVTEKIPYITVRITTTAVRELVG